MMQTLFVLAMHMAFESNAKHAPSGSKRPQRSSRNDVMTTSLAAGGEPAEFIFTDRRGCLVEITAEDNKRAGY